MATLAARDRVDPCWIHWRPSHAHSSSTVTHCRPSHRVPGWFIAASVHWGSNESSLKGRRLRRPVLWATLPRSGDEDRTYWCSPTLSPAGRGSLDPLPLSRERG